MIIQKQSILAPLLFLLIWSASLQGKSRLSVKILARDSTKKVKMTFIPAGGYEPETSVKLGMASFILFKNSSPDSRYYRPSTISSYFLYTFNHQILSKVKWKMFFKNGINLTTNYQYFDFPDRFFGVGDNVERGTSERFINRFYSFRGQLYKRLDERHFSGVRYELQHNELSEIPEGSDLLHDELHGVTGGRTIGIGPAYKYDSRNNVLYPTKGAFISIDIAMVSEFIGSEYEYVNYEIDWRKYFTLKDEKNVFAFQANFNLTSGDNTPFYKLPSLGGVNRLRGIQNSRLYRDRQAIYFQSEYRRKLFWRLGATVFAGGGDIERRIKNFSLARFKYTTGVGLRYSMLKDETLNLRLDWGIGPSGQSAFYIAVKEAF